MKLPTTQRGHVFRRLLTISFIVVTCSLLFYTNDFYARFMKHVYTPWQAWSVFASPADSDMSVVLPQIWEPFIHNLSDTHFVTDEKREYDIKPDAHRWEPMKQRILIVDVDTRLDLGRGAMLNKETPRRETMKGRTAGIMNHFLYALVHGYDYRLVRAPDFTDRHGTWVKVPIVREALKTHDIVVFLDSDAIFEYINMPFEWLMSMWNITPEILVAMAEDPKSQRNSDSNGWVMFNTGFIVAQNSDRTAELMERWENCPTGERYANCTRWAYDWAHEQAAFSNHVRYDYDKEKDMRVISCMDGNGMPGPHGGSGCNGVFIRHYWFGKDSTVRELYNMLSADMITKIHRHFHDRIDKYFVDASAWTYPLKNLII